MAENSETSEINTEPTDVDDGIDETSQPETSFERSVYTEFFSIVANDGKNTSEPLGCMLHCIMLQIAITCILLLLH
jgi:hypothetical protein